MGTNSLWQRFQQFYLHYDDLGFSLDISRMRFSRRFPRKDASIKTKASEPETEEFSRIR